MEFTRGLVTITFRKLSPREVVELAGECGLIALEWGGDVHVPPGDVANAREVARLTADAGLSVHAYGSYVRLGEDDAATFPPVIETAAALGAPSIRVWAGRRGSAAADSDYRRRVVDATVAFAEIARRSGIDVCYEFHRDTLTDTDESAVDLLRATEIRSLWQPPHERTLEQNLASLRTMLPWLGHVHVFHWPTPGERVPLADGAERWRAYLKLLKQERREVPLLLEFVRGDDPDQLRADAATLRGWIAELSPTE
jgi:sugar phosphate isomerase/epimerase